jgi:hypothetical protein
VAYDERNCQVFYPPPCGLQYRGSIYSEAKQFLHASCDLLYQVTQPAMSRVVLVTEVPWETDRHSGSFHEKGREFKFESLRVAQHQFFPGQQPGSHATRWRSHSRNAECKAGRAKVMTSESRKEH